MRDEAKVVAMHTRPTPIELYEADGELRRLIPLIQGGKTFLSYALLHSLSDKQFEIVCGLPYDFEVNKQTQKYIIDRASQLGIRFGIDLKNKKIIT